MLTIAMGGLSMPAQEGFSDPDGRIVVDDSVDVTPIDLYFLKNGKFRTDIWKVGDKDLFFTPYVNFVYEGRDYRKLSKAAAARYDAMDRVGVRRGGLYLDGKRVRTNVLWVAEVLAAYTWNGGVIVSARTSRWHPKGGVDIGFIGQRANRCRFSKLMGGNFERAAKAPSFLVPVTMDAGGRDLALDVAFPEVCYANEAFDVTVSLTNASDRPIMVPDSLFEGLGLSHLNFHWKYPGPDAQARCSPLLPSEKRETVVPFGRIVAHPWDEFNAFRTAGRRDLYFYWDGFLEPGDVERMSRFFCEKRVDVVGRAVDASRRDLLLEVAAPEKVPRGGRFDVALALTNVSDVTVLVPDSLGDGLGAVWSHEYVRAPDGRREVAGTRRGRKLKKAGNEVGYECSHTNHPVFRSPYRASCSPLGPGERREGRASVGVSWPGRRHRVEFHWDWLPDPDDGGRVARFSAGEKWIEVRNW
jgi:hypothetical protein